jgi:hypothetical protein
MKDQDHSLPQVLGSNLLVQVEAHPVRPMAKSEEPNLWDPCLPDSLLWQCPANPFSQVRFKSIGTLVVAKCHPHRKRLLLFQM